MIRLSNGESYEIRHPEYAALSKTKVIVTFPEEDREVFCSLTHINSVEMLQRA
jgi:tRNA-binding EMAP/Myf-like protein